MASPNSSKPHAKIHIPQHVGMKGLREFHHPRSRFLVVQKEKDYITIDDIVKLRNERNILLEKRRELSSKVVRLINSEKIPPPCDRAMKQIAESLEKQVETLKYMIYKKKEQINAILNSDLAAIITEHQEMTKLYHLELLRLKRNKKKIEKEYSNLNSTYSSILEQYSQKQISLNQSYLRDLRKEVFSLENRLERVRNPVARLQEEEDEKRSALIEKIKVRRRRCNKEKIAIKHLKRKLEKLKSQVKPRYYI